MEQLLFNITQVFRVELILLWILFCCLDGLYMKMTGYDKWYLICLPFVNSFLKCKLLAISVLVVIPYAWCLLMTFINGWSYLTVFAIGFKSVLDIQFAKYYVDCNPYVYALVPFAKYFYKIREIKNERTQSG